MVNINFMNPRLIHLTFFVICSCLLGYGYYLQYVEYLEPCPLCMVQRVAFLAIALTALISAIHGPQFLGIRIYSGLLVFFSTFGGAIASRQIWLQHLPKDQIPECGPGLSFMLETAPFLDVVKTLIIGTGDCAEVVWTFLGFSIPEWALVMFVSICIVNLIIFKKA